MPTHCVITTNGWAHFLCGGRAWVWVAGQGRVGQERAEGSEVLGGSDWRGGHFRPKSAEIRILVVTFAQKAEV
ncbi:hypothetical protein B9G54_07585 [Alloscardovia macacae]|nr:hypothetical protein B9G54_07585 [Alloscardovia macacae]